MFVVGTSTMIVMMLIIEIVQIMIVIDKGGTVTMISIMPPSPVPSKTALHQKKQAAKRGATRATKT